MPRCLFAALASLLLWPAFALGAEEGKRFALLVGVKEYDHASLPPLRHTEADAEAMAKLLKDGGFAEVVVLTTTRGGKDDKAKPTAENIRRQLRRLSNLVKRHDLLLVGLSGHGLQLTVVDPKTEKERDESFFCPSDAKPRNKEPLAELKKTMIPLAELFKELDDSGAGVRLLLVDACRNEPKSDRGRNMDIDDLPRPSKGTAALFSCKSGERAFESDKLGHGVFFHHVIEALKGEAKNKKGEVTWDTLSSHVREKVVDDVPTLIGGGAKQTPHEMRNIEGRSPVLLDLATDQKVAERLYKEGIDYYTGQTREFDEDKAYRAFREAARKGHAVAAAQVGLMLNEGVGTTKDNDEGLRQIKAALPGLRKAAEGGDSFAMTLLGFLIAFKQEMGKVGDYQEADRWFRKAADKGDAQAMSALGALSLAGMLLGVEGAQKKAVNWYRQAADKGDLRTMVALGRDYESGSSYGFGLGLPRDEKEAARLFRKAADRGHPEAMLRLGLKYEEGRGVPKDDKEAVGWYRKAADKGNAAAMSSLGSMYEEGRGTKKDLLEAIRWYQMAADKGDQKAKDAITRIRKGK